MNVIAGSARKIRHRLHNLSKSKENQMDFFRIIAPSGGHTGDIDILGVEAVVVEIVEIVAVSLVLMLVMRLLPEAVAKYGWWGLLKRLGSCSARPKTTTNRVSASLASGAPREETKKVTAAESATSQGVPSPTPAVTSVSEPSTTKATGSNVATDVNLDSLLDEFYDEEDLMDDAFISTLSGTAKSADAPVETLTVGSTAPAQNAMSPPTPAASAPNQSTSDVDAALAKKMMRCFQPPSSKTSKAKVSEVSSNAALKEAPTSQAKPSAVMEAPAQPAKPSAPKEVAPVRAQPTKPVLAANDHDVDLDDVFDELQTTDEALQEALLDATLAASAA